MSWCWLLFPLVVGCARSGDLRTPDDDTAGDSAFDEDSATIEDSEDSDSETAEDTAEDSEDTDDTQDTADTGPEPVESGTSLPAPATLPLDAVAEIGDRLDALLAGETHGAYVVDLDNGEVIYASNEDTPRKPASNTKLYTTAALLGLLGEEARLTTDAYAGAAPNGQGHVQALTVRIGHDPSWTADVYESDAFPAERLAEALFDAGVRSVGTLTVAGEVLVGGNTVGTYSVTGNREAAMGVLDDALDGAGITVGTVMMSGSMATPAGVRLTSRESVPLGVIVQPINSRSHNEMSDLLGRHLAFALDGVSDAPTGGEVVVDFIDGLGIDASALHFNDGSGLSHGNRITARATVELFAAMDEHPAGPWWYESLSISGVRGTLTSRMTGTNTWGRVYGKSGTLSDTITLSGVLYHAKDGHRYAFSFLLNDVTSWPEARALLDDCVEVLAEDWRGGSALPTPTLRYARAIPGNAAEIAWEPVSGAGRYALWRSTDGLTWDRAQATAEAGPTAVITDLPAGRTTYVRVTAERDARRSFPSTVLSVRPGVEPVLLVDGNDRWAEADENPLGAGHRFLAETARALAHPHDSAHHDAILDGDVELGGRPAVIWVSGEESSEHTSFDAEERALLTEYLDDGGALLVSGSEIGWDLVDVGDAASAAFYQDWLRATYLADDAETRVAAPEPGWFADLPEVGFYTPGQMFVGYPDVLAARSGSTPILRYVGGTGGVAGLAYDGDYRLVILGFPLESVDTHEDRAVILDEVKGFFGL